MSKFTKANLRMYLEGMKGGASVRECDFTNGILYAVECIENHIENMEGN